MNPLSYLTITAVCLVLAALIERAEQQSRGWYQDRAMLRASGFFLGVGVVSALAILL